MSPLADAYYTKTLEMLALARERNAATIARLAPILGASIAGGGMVHTFGSGHSDIIAREIVGRAGGLVCIGSIPDPTAGFIENLVGYGTTLAERYDRQDPHTVRRELATSGDMLADRFDAVSGSEWRRVGFRSDGAQFTVESFGRYLLHDPIHHLWDVAHIF